MHHKLVFLHGADRANIKSENHENHLVFYDQNVQLLDNILLFLRCTTTLLMLLNKFAFLSKFFWNKLYNHLMINYGIKWRFFVDLNPILWNLYWVVFPKDDDLIQVWLQFLAIFCFSVSLLSSNHKLQFPLNLSHPRPYFSMSIQ